MYTFTAIKYDLLGTKQWNNAGFEREGATPSQLYNLRARQATAHSAKIMMQQSSDATNTEVSQALANAVLTHLSPPPDQSDASPIPLTDQYASNLQEILVAATPRTPPPAQHNASGSASSLVPQTRVSISYQDSLLPSLLRYVDNILMRSKPRHDHPPDATQACVNCKVQWDRADVTSTFLPLCPCDHWIHYRCLIWLATLDERYRDKCPACKTQLFEWDGISALTLATRTSLPMGNEQFTITTPGHHPVVTSDRSEYEHESRVIEEMIERRFVTQIGAPGRSLKASVDLVQCFNDVLNDLKTMGRPQTKWLGWVTTTGSLLFGILVAIKMRRILLDGYPLVTQTEAWSAWESGCQSMQRALLEDVHKE
ncbi:hypothetical protein OPT61_g5093 [Boeremia exigua]|uniref:Uncharacterized protein n=1 Tax=Boeremia exigua TaxID=749465 RepID=A0ACC2IBN6_9PLEO|nr:hypothetical protein OPT61_g5093 [Boeremia exigua]